MSAPVRPLQPLKLPAGPASRTPEQIYWSTFKSQLLLPSPSNTPVTHISYAPPPINISAPPSDHFAVTTGAKVQFYSIKTRKLMKTISRFDDTAHGAEIRRDGRVMAAGDDTGVIQVFDIGSRAILKTWKEHKQPVWSVRFSSSELTTLMSTSDDQTVRLWDLPSQDSITTFVGHQDYVRTGAFMSGQDAGLLVSGSYDQTVKIWDPRYSGRAAVTFKHVAPVECVLPMHSGTTILAAAGNQISVLDLIAGRPLKLIQNHQKTVTSLCFASNGSRLVSGGLDGHVKVFETSAWNVVSGSKYPSPILSLGMISSGASREDRHLAVGMQNGSLSIRTRLSGQQKVKDRERQKEMQALIEGNIEQLDKRRAKKRTSGWDKRLRGQDFTGEGADVIIAEDRKTKTKDKPWQAKLRKGKYSVALDLVLDNRNLLDIVTLLTALRHRSAMRNALSGRDEMTLQPILRWTCRYITNPKYVNLCVDVGVLILDLYSTHMGQSQEIDNMMRELHRIVRREVARAQQAWQTKGMLDMLLTAPA
ncbi:hypothetical protein MMC09_006712 [Bachmanniomyces sp. S44760]|nr:hypothetical protein [Bachmanniomyces sp. S44760]